MGPPRIPPSTRSPVVMLLWGQPGYCFSKPPYPCTLPPLIPTTAWPLPGLASVGAIYFTEGLARPPDSEGAAPASPAQVSSQGHEAQGEPGGGLCRDIRAKGPGVQTGAGREAGARGTPAHTAWRVRPHGQAPEQGCTTPPPHSTLQCTERTHLRPGSC